MLIPKYQITAHLDGPAFNRTPSLTFGIADDPSSLQKIKCITRRSLTGLLKSNFYGTFYKKRYTAFTIKQKTKGLITGRSYVRKMILLVKSEDLESLIGKTALESIRKLPSNSRARVKLLKQHIGPLNPNKINGLPPTLLKNMSITSSSRTDSSSSTDFTADSLEKNTVWGSFSQEINDTLHSIFPQITKNQMQEMRQALNRVLQRPESFVLGFADFKTDENRAKILFGKQEGKLVIEKAKFLAQGSNAAIYKFKEYAVKIQNIIGATDDDKLIFNSAGTKEEIEALQDVEDVPGTLKVVAPVLGVDSLEPIGFISKLYTGNFKDYCLSSSPLKLPEAFIQLSGTFSGMHKKDKVHNDIKPENIFANFDDNGLKEIVVGDISKTAFDQSSFTISPQYTFKSEFEKIDALLCSKKPTKAEEKEVLSLRKKLDVRGFAFLMHCTLAKGLELLDPFPLEEDSIRGYPKEFPSKEERIAQYVEISETSASKELRDYVKMLLTVNCSDLPSMEEVHQSLISIQSKEVSS